MHQMANHAAPDDIVFGRSFRKSTRSCEDSSKVLCAQPVELDLRTESGRDIAEHKAALWCHIFVDVEVHDVAWMSNIVGHLELEGIARGMFQKGLRRSEIRRVHDVARNQVGEPARSYCTSNPARFFLGRQS